LQSKPTLAAPAIPNSAQLAVISAETTMLVEPIVSGVSAGRSVARADRCG